MDEANFPPSTEIPAFDSAQLAISANETLESAVNQATNQAFNLGCLLGLLPAAIFTLIIFLVSGFSIISIFIGVLLGIIGAVAFANLAAVLTRRNTTKRVYQETINPEIEKSLKANGVTRPNFDASAREVLASTAPLYEFLTPIPEKTTNPADVG